MRRTVLLAVAVTALAVLAAGVYAAPRAAGRVKIGGENVAIEFKLAKKLKVTVTPKGIRFPVGTYSPWSYKVMKFDRKSGKVWSLECSRPLGSLSSFTVEEGKTTVLEIDPTIIVWGSVSKQRNKHTGRMSFDIWPVYKGKDGQQYEPFARMRHRRMAPRYQIEDEKGKVLDKGKFGFG